MKTITYRGEQYEVEDWVNFVAMDIDGDIYGYETKPENGLSDEWLNTGGKVFWIGSETNNWENSLEKV